MNAAVPVETSEEDRMKSARRERVLIANQNMVELMRIFFRHMAERDARHLGSGGGV